MSLSTNAGGAAPSDAAERFRHLVESLPDEYRKLFLSCHDDQYLLDEIKALKLGRRWGSSRHLAQFESFIAAVKPLFAALDVFCQVDPIHFATIWGGIRVLVQLTCKFVSFYKNFAQALDDISSHLIFFRHVRDQIVTSKSPRLQALLPMIFDEILEFLMGVMRIFHTSDGKTKSVGRVYASTTWKPFRFDETVIRMKEYRQQVIAELVVLQAVNTEKVSALLLDQSPQKTGVKGKPHPDQRSDFSEFISRMRAWLDPPPYASAYQDMLELRMPRTSNWIFDQPAYHYWSSIKERSATLWIHGKAGSGKSVLAAGLVDNGKTASPDQSPFYFFFSSLKMETNFSGAAFSAILSQILQRHHNNVKLLDIFHFLVNFNSDGQLIASYSELVSIFELCLQLPELNNSVIILDGIDECWDANTHLFPGLKQLVLHTHIKIVLLSRSTIQGWLKRIPDVIELYVGHLNSGDIQLYLEDELSTAIDEDYLPQSLDRVEISQRLTIRANGMFLWARLMMVYLKSPGLLMSERVEAISNVGLPEGLETMYARILKHMIKLGKTSLRLACYIFMCLMHTKRELSSKELEDAVVSRKRSGFNEPSREISNFGDIVLSVCGGFVEKAWIINTDKTKTPSFRFIHSSAMEYLEDEPRRKEKGTSVFEDIVLISPQLAAHASLATLSINYMIYALPKNVPLPPQVYKDELLTKLPLSYYAAMYWPSHILYSNGDQAAMKVALSQEPGAYTGLISALCQLVSSPDAISAWIQTCYSFAQEPPLQDLSIWIERASRADFPWRKHFLQLDDIIPDIRDLASFTHKVTLEWGPHLVRDPSCVWEEVGAFSPSAFSINPHGTTVKKFISETPSPTLACNSIHKISQLMPDGEHSYILSVFPSKGFEERSGDLDWSSSCSERLNCSTGWVARLEVFPVQECKVVASLEIPLHAEEVCLQMYQSMAPSPSGCSIQVPLSISPAGRYFTVLNTVYIVKGELPNLSYTSESIKFGSSELWKLPNESWPLEAGHLYLYWMYFDRNERYLAFVTQSNPDPLSVRVYTLRNDELPLINFSAETRKALRKPSKDYYPGRDKREFELAFHPNLPALAVAGLSGVFLWDFNPISCSRGFVNLETGNNINHDKIRMFCFSADGSSCILQTHGNLPEVLDVSKHLCPNGTPNLPAPQQLTEESDHEERNVDDSTLSLVRGNTASTSGALTLASESPGVLLAGVTALSLHGQNAGEAVLANEGDAVSISKLGSSNKEHSVILTRIPRWSGSHELQPGVALPTDSGDAVMIMLDKRPSTANRISAGQAEPMVIERKISSIQRANQALSRQPVLTANESDASHSLGTRVRVLEDGDLPPIAASGEPEGQSKNQGSEEVRDAGADATSSGSVAGGDGFSDMACDGLVG